MRLWGYSSTKMRLVTCLRCKRKISSVWGHYKTIELYLPVPFTHRKRHWVIKRHYCDYCLLELLRKIDDENPVY